MGDNMYPYDLKSLRENAPCLRTWRCLLLPSSVCYLGIGLASPLEPDVEMLKCPVLFQTSCGLDKHPDEPE